MVISKGYEKRCAGAVYVPWSVSITIAALGFCTLGFASIFAFRVKEENNQDLSAELSRLGAETTQAESELAALGATGKIQAAELKAKRDENTRAAERIAGRRVQVKVVEDQNRAKIAQSQGKLEDARKSEINEVNQANALLRENALQERKKENVKKSLAVTQENIVTVVSSEGLLATGFLYQGANALYVISARAIVPEKVRLSVKLRGRRFNNQAESQAFVLPVGRAFLDKSGLALLTLNDQGEHLLVKSFSAQNASAAKVGEKVFASGTQVMGNAVMELNVADGVVSSTSRAVGAQTYMQVSIPANPGSCGSPILNEDGFLVGVLMDPLEGLEKSSIAVPSSEIEDAIARAERR